LIHFYKRKTFNKRKCDIDLEKDLRKGDDV